MEKTIDSVDLHVGARIQARRIEQGLNQSQLGRALGLTFQQVQKYEKGTNRVSASKLYATARFLEVPISYFFAGLESMDGGGADTEQARRLRYAMSPLGSELLEGVMKLSRQWQEIFIEMIQAIGRTTSGR